MTIRGLLATAAVAVLAGAGLAACSSSDSGSDTLSFCTDPTYPPAEFYQVSKVGTTELKPVLVGADIDIARAVGKKLDKTVHFVNTRFSTIISSLQAKKCDAIIALFNDTAQRRKTMAFVEYLAAGQDTMLKKDDPPVRAVADLYGRTVSVASGTTEEDFLKSQNSTAPTGKQITIKTYSSQNDAILAVKNRSAQVYFGDAPVVENAVSADDSLVRGAELVKPIPMGIALRRSDKRISDVRTAVKQLYDAGSMGQILAKWKFSRYAITP